MTTHIFTDSKNRQIQVFTDTTTLTFRTDVFNLATRSSYMLGWADDQVHHIPNLHSVYTQRELSSVKFLEGLDDSIKNVIGGKHIEKCIVNLSNNSDTNFVHTHPNKLVLLYYINLEWMPHFHGETLFYNDDMAEIEYASPFVPGKFILFDGEIPHTIRPQSSAGPKYRFTMSMILNK